MRLVSFLPEKVGNREIMPSATSATHASTAGAMNAPSVTSPRNPRNMGEMASSAPAGAGMPTKKALCHSGASSSSSITLNRASLSAQAITSARAITQPRFFSACSDHR